MLHVGLGDTYSHPVLYSSRNLCFRPTCPRVLSPITLQCSLKSFTDQHSGDPCPGEHVFYCVLPGRRQAAAPGLTSRRTGRRPAGDLAHGHAACWKAHWPRWARHGEVSCSRPGPARRCKPPPSQRMPTLKTRSEHSAESCGQGPRSRRFDICYVVYRGGRESWACWKMSCASRTRKHGGFEKNLCGTAAVCTGAAGLSEQSH